MSKKKKKNYNDYYVYMYWRLDINEPFYIGKGRGYRWKRLNRDNSHFNNIVKKYPIAVEIIKDNLTEEQALGVECFLINQLVFEEGYSIDIQNNRSKNRKTQHLVNCTWGGEGTSGHNAFENKTNEEMLQIKQKTKETWDKKTEEEKKEINKKKGKKGCGNYWNNGTKSNEELEEIKRKISEKGKQKKCSDETRKKISQASSGKNNAMFGKNPRDFMTKEQLEIHDKKLSQSLKEVWENKTEEELILIKTQASQRQKGTQNSHANLFKVIFVDKTEKIMCAKEVYTKDGFLQISPQSFKKYILPNDKNECIINTLNIIENGNTKEMIEKLIKWNGVKIIRYNGDENE